MGVVITGHSLSSVAASLQHGPSGSHIQTMAPTDNGGDGSTFSPTDLLAGALGACGVTTMTLFAGRSKIPLEKVEFSVEKIMTSTAPRRVSSLLVTYILTTDALEADVKRLVEAGKKCPVKLSLNEGVEVKETWQWRTSPQAPLVTL